jgi:hypothetical protein
VTCCITRDDLRFSNATKTFERPYLGFSRQLCCSQPCPVQNAQSNPSTIFAVGEMSQPALMLSHHHLTPATAASAAVLASWSSAALEQPLCTHRHTNADAQTEDQASGQIRCCARRRTTDFPRFTSPPATIPLLPKKIPSEILTTTASALSSSENWSGSSVLRCAMKLQKQGNAFDEHEQAVQLLKKASQVKQKVGLIWVVQC